MVVREACPACGSERFKRHGPSHPGQQHHHCTACGRQFGSDAAPHVLAEAQRALVQRLLREPISLRGIGRAVGVSLRWLLRFLVTGFAALPAHLHGQPVASPRHGLIGHLEVEADALGSFVQQQATQPWVWSAMDKQTRHMLAFHVGDRSHDRAKQLWANLPAVSREPALCYTDP